MNAPLLTQVLDRCVETDEGCWLYTGRLLPNGYGVVSESRKTVYVHRLTFGYFKADIPDGLVIDHLCRNRACCNPEHLDAVTQRVNVHRGDSHVAQQAKKRKCIRGHDLSGDNVRVSRSGKRECKTCHRARQLDRTRRMRAAGLMDRRGYRIYPEGVAS
ncbi:MAG: HNH endonuclease [Streptomycetaceae bacterium]|nr:HNH endonuclease [Streptomycetaceae bacterium]